MDSGPRTRSRERWVGQSDRHISGAHQRKSARQSGLEVDFVAMGAEAVVNTQIENSIPPANGSGAVLARPEEHDEWGATDPCSRNTVPTAPGGGVARD